MPLYEYQCDACGARFERIQKYSDAPIAVCPTCGGAVRKLISSPAIQFKGSGFYITDYAKSDPGATDKSEKSEKSDKSEKADKSDKSAATDSKTTEGESGKKGEAGGGSSSSPSTAGSSGDASPSKSSSTPSKSPGQGTPPAKP
jgi:putative FmdB family regulatory protein